MKLKYFQIESNAFKVEAYCQQLGDDFLISIYGGAAHIGAIGMAQPRASLKNSDKRSATASVFCYLGHKEDEVVKYVAERLASQLDAKIVVAAGLHWDNLTPEGIDTVMKNIDVLVEQLIEFARKK